MPSPKSLASNAVGDGQSLPEPNRTTRATIKPGAIGSLKAGELVDLIDKLRRDVFSDGSDVRWVHRYHESVPVYRKSEQPKDTWRRHVSVAREVEAPDLEGLFKWLKHTQDKDTIHHLEVRITDDARSLRMDLGSSHGAPSRTVKFETIEPDDDAALTRSVVRAFNPLRERVAKRVQRTVFAWMWLPIAVAYIFGLVIDRTVKYGHPSENMSKAELVAGVSLAGAIFFSIALIRTVKRVHRRAEFHIVSDTPLQKASRSTRERMTQAVHSVGHTLSRRDVRVPLSVLVPALMLVATILSLLVAM